MRYYILLLMLGAAATSCDRDSVDTVKFDVTVQNNGTVSAGQDAVFLFSGNADYITFYSGAPESNYEHRNRTEAELAALKMSCTIRQQYNDLDYLNREIFFAYVSTDFSGIYTPEELNKATWTPLSGREYNRLPVPVPASASPVETSGSIDLGAYVGLEKDFYIAFLYKAAGRASIPQANGGGRYTNRPRIDVSGLSMQKTTTDGEVVNVENAITEWGFRPVYQQSTGNKNYQVNDNGLLFQPQKAVTDASTGREPDETVWMVSALIRPKAVEPDRGMAIKSIEANLNSYASTYKEPGSYTATFVATNANLWNGSQVVKQVTVNVIP